MKSLQNALEHLCLAKELAEMCISKGKVSPIDRDLLLDKLRKAYELVLFETEEEKPAVAAPPVLVESKKVEVQNVPEIPIVSPKPEVKPSITFEKKTRSEVADIAAQKPASTYKPHEIKQIEIEIQEAVTGKTKRHAEPSDDKGHTEILADKYHGKQRFRNETLTDQTPKTDITSRLQNKPIGDLTKAIGINDKFHYTKELFGGNSGLYSSTIKTLNGFTSINEALIFIQENFTWDENNEAAKGLIDLVRRKLLRD